MKYGMGGYGYGGYGGGYGGYGGGYGGVSRGIEVRRTGWLFDSILGLSLVWLWAGGIWRM